MKHIVVIKKKEFQISELVFREMTKLGYLEKNKETYRRKKEKSDAIKKWAGGNPGQVERLVKENPKMGNLIKADSNEQFTNICMKANDAFLTGFWFAIGSLTAASMIGLIGFIIHSFAIHK